MCLLGGQCLDRDVEVCVFVCLRHVWDGNPVVFLIPALSGASEFHHVCADVCVCDAAGDYHVTQRTQRHLQQQQR